MVAQMTTRPLFFDVAVNEGEGWEISGRKASRKLTRRLTSASVRALVRPKELLRCRFCRSVLRLGIECTERDYEVPELGLPMVRGYSLRFCARCAHWRFWSVEDRCMDYPRSICAVSVQTRFASDVPPGCIPELAQCLIRYPAQWNQLNPRTLEHLVAEVFRCNFAPCEVTHVGRTADGGVDVVFVQGNECRWLIQVKGRQDPAASESVRTIRELVGTLVDKGVPRGIVVSTANAFSKPAQAAVRRYDERGFLIRLFDRGLLQQLIGPLVPSRPWETLFASPEFEHLGNQLRCQIEASLVPDQLSLYD
jgi:hypothetical protein